MQLLSILGVLLVMSVQGNRRYLVREDQTDMGFLSTYNDSKPWTIYIDEILYRMRDITNIEGILIHLLRTAITAEHWCKVPDTQVGLYNYTSKNTRNTLLANISDWLPCGVLVIQKFPSPTTEEKTITIQVNVQLHINLTLTELHTESIVRDAENDIILHLSEEGNTDLTEQCCTCTFL